MKKVLIAVALLIVGTIVVLTARNGLREYAAATPPGSEAVTRAGVTANGEPALGPEGEAPANAAGPSAGEPAGESVLAESGSAPEPNGSRAASPTSSTPGSSGTGAQEPTTSGQASGKADPDEPDYEKVLRRAASIYTRAGSLQANFSQQSMNPILRTTVSSSGTLYQRRPDLFLMKFSDPAGDLIVSDGSHFWVYYPSVDRKQVIRMPAAMGAGGLDLQSQFLGDPLERFSVTYEGREDLAGRSAYLLRLEPRESMGYRLLRVWIDPSDYLVRRFEVTEESGIVRDFRLSDLRLDPNLPTGLFRFEVPEGATIVDRG